LKTPVHKFVKRPVVIAGAFPNAGGICAVRHYDWDDMNRVPICWIKNDIVQAFRAIDVGKEVLYAPSLYNTNEHGSAAKSNDCEDCRSQSNQPNDDLAQSAQSSRPAWKRCFAGLFKKFTAVRS
jgi:hypothetical protein